MIAFLVLMLLFLTPVWSLAQESEETEKKEPSLAEIARKERQRRAQINQPVKVITNATLKDVKGLVRSGAESSSSKTATQDNGDSEPSEDRKKDAMEWENLFGGARERLVSAINQGEQLEQRMTELSAGWVRVSAGDTDSTLEEEFNRQNQQIGQELEIQAARDAIETMDREARLEGVLPGTIRQRLEGLP